MAPTGFRSAVGTALSLIGPLLAIVAGIVAGRRWLRPASPIASSAPDAIALAWVIPATAVALAALAIWSQSGWGVSAALVLGVIAVTDWIRRDPRHRSDTGAAGSGWERAAS